MKKIMALWSALVIAAGLAVAGSAPVQAAPSFVSTAIVSPAVGSSVMGPDGKTYKVGSNPKGIVAPKGALAKNTKAGGVHTNALTTCPGATPVCFHYAGGVQFVVADGSYSNLTNGQPFLASYDYHSLVEQAAIRHNAAGNRNIVEIGATVDRGINASCTPAPACKDKAYLFTYAWVNGVGLCYNGCGFVQAASPAPQVGVAGGALPLTTVQYAVQHFGNAWWVAYNSAWAGYWPDSLWAGQTPAFTTADEHQPFFEVASKYTRSCSDMGTGDLPGVGGANLNAARVGSFNLLNPPAGTVPDMTPFIPSSPGNPTTDYDGQIVTPSVRTGRGGGPGGNATGTGVGTKGAC